MSEPKNDDPAGCPATVLGKCEPACARCGRDLDVSVGDTLALAGAYDDQLREAANLMLITLRAHGVPGGPVWNAYWNLHEEIHHDGVGKP